MTVVRRSRRSPRSHQDQRRKHVGSQYTLFYIGLLLALSYMGKILCQLGMRGVTNQVQSSVAAGTILAAQNGSTTSRKMWRSMHMPG